MGFLDFLMSSKTLALLSLGHDAMGLAEGIAEKDAQATAASFLTLIQDTGKLGHIKELSPERLAKYQQGMTLVTEALFQDVG